MPIAIPTMSSPHRPISIAVCLPVFCDLLSVAKHTVTNQNVVLQWPRSEPRAKNRARRPARRRPRKGPWPGSASARRRDPRRPPGRLPRPSRRCFLPARRRRLRHTPPMRRRRRMTRTRITRSPTGMPSPGGNSGVYLGNRVRINQGGNECFGILPALSFWWRGVGWGRLSSIMHIGICTASEAEDGDQPACASYSLFTSSCRFKRCAAALILPT